MYQYQVRITNDYLSLNRGDFDGDISLAMYFIRDFCARHKVVVSSMQGYGRLEVNGVVYSCNPRNMVIPLMIKFCGKTVNFFNDPLNCKNLALEYLNSAVFTVKRLNIPEKFSTERQELQLAINSVEQFLLTPDITIDDIAYQHMAIVKKLENLYISIENQEIESKCCKFFSCRFFKGQDEASITADNIMDIKLKINLHMSNEDGIYENAESKVAIEQREFRVKI